MHMGSKDSFVSEENDKEKKKLQGLNVGLVDIT